MRLKFKLLALVFLVCGLLSTFTGYLLWHSWQVRNHTKRFIPALSYLCSISDARSWMTRQVKDGFDFLISEEKLEHSEYSRAAHQVSAAFVSWKEAIGIQQSLGVAGEGEDLARVEQLQADYQQWQELNLDIFRNLHDTGSKKAVHLYDDGVKRIVQAKVYERLDDALEDGLAEVDDEYRATLLVLGSTPWTARTAYERLQLTKSTINYLVAASNLSSALNRQVSALVDYLYLTQEDHHQYLLMQEQTYSAFDDLLTAYRRRQELSGLESDPLVERLRGTMQKVQALADELYRGHKSGKSLIEVRETSEQLEKLLDAELVPCLIRALQQGSSDLQDLTNTANEWLVGLIAVVCIVFGVLALKLIRGIFTAIEQLREGMAIIADGNYAYRIELVRDDELGELAAAFDRMGMRLERTRHELEDLYRGMEKRVIERTQQLQLANQELESFNYSVSHDLRGALTQVSGLTQLLMVDGGRMPAAEAQGYRERICLATARMARTIDGLLQLSRLSGREVRRLPVDVSAIVQDVAAELQDNDPKRVVQFHLAPDVVVMGDEVLLRLAMENLLGNAWKYTASEPTARIEFGVLQRNGETSCYVRDNGIGFDNCDAEKIFTPFVRLDNAAPIAGEGVGLATVQRIILRHGGTIRAEGVPGGGATFVFTLPSAQPGN